MVAPGDAERGYLCFARHQNVVGRVPDHHGCAASGPPCPLWLARIIEGSGFEDAYPPSERWRNRGRGFPARAGPSTPRCDLPVAMPSTRPLRAPSASMNAAHARIKRARYDRAPGGAQSEGGLVVLGKRARRSRGRPGPGSSWATAVTSDYPTTLRMLSRDGATRPLARKASSIAATIPCWLSTSAPSQSKMTSFISRPHAQTVRDRTQEIPGRCHVLAVAAPSHQASSPTPTDAE